MKIGSLLRNPDLKAPVLNGLTGLAGFAAGVLMGGLIALAQTPPSQVGDWPSLPTSTVDAPTADPIPVQTPSRALPASPWASESEKPAPLSPTTSRG